MGKRQANKLKNRKEIVDAATQLFIEKGVSNTTIDDIVKNTSLARGTFYNYFKSKEEIWDYLIANIFVDVNIEVNVERKKATSKHEFLYNSYFSAFTLLSQPPLPALIAKNQVAFRETLFNNTEIFSLTADLEDDLRNSGLFDGFPEHHYKMMPYTMVGAGLEMVIQKHLNNDTFTVEEMSKFITDVLIKGWIPKNSKKKQ